MVEGYPQEYVYSEAELAKFREQPEELVKHAKFLENQLNNRWDVFFMGSQMQEFAQMRFKARMRQFIKDDRLLEGKCSTTLPIFRARLFNLFRGHRFHTKMVLWL